MGDFAGITVQSKGNLARKPSQKPLLRLNSHIDLLMMATASREAEGVEQLDGGVKPDYLETGCKLQKFKTAVGMALRLQQSESGYRRLNKRKKRFTQLNLNATAETLDVVNEARLTPLERFRKVARGVKVLASVCKVCKNYMMDWLLTQQWHQMFATVLADGDSTFRRGNNSGIRPFIKWAPKEEGSDEMVAVTFDLRDFKKEGMAEELLTDDIKTMLEKLPDTRTSDDNREIARYLSRVCKAFSKLPMELQRKVAGAGFYDCYYKDRVIIRKDLPSDGVYYVLTGELIEKAHSERHPRDITVGETFGEDDLVSGSLRKGTVVTKCNTELFYLHRLDYRRIFNLSSDAYDPSQLDIIKRDEVMSKFPINLLVENSGTWSCLHYKAGSLIAKDSNILENIYVVKSGEARVLKYMSTKNVDMAARNKRVAAERAAEDPYRRKRRLLKFVSDGIRSEYRPETYTPRTSLPALPKSAPPGVRPKRNHPAAVSLSLPSPIRPATRGYTRERGAERRDALANKMGQGGAYISTRPQTTVPNNRRRQAPDPDPVRSAAVQRQPSQDNADTPEKTPQDPEAPRASFTLPPEEGTEEQKPKRMSGLLKRKITKMQMLMHATQKSVHKPEPEDDGLERNVPPFVQLESLHAGQVFGLRSCLEAKEQGPTASLVSAGCEVLQINKKFFLRYTDPSVFEIIKLKCKAYPTEAELLDRLSVTLEWSDFCKVMLRDHLDHQDLVDRCKTFRA